MSAFEWGLQLVLLLLLGFAIPFAIRLERGLAALRRDRGALDGSAQGLAEAAAAADATLRRLRATAEEEIRQLDERAGAAERLRDDLRYLTERAESLADRLDGLVRAARPLAAEAGPAVAQATQAAQATEDPAPPRSQAERDLMRALRMAR
jgi:methyl-accepting chemotaxis protein